MPPKKRAEDAMEEEEEDIFEDASEPMLFEGMSDRQVDDELRLPPALSSISRRERRQLLLFKRNNNEVC